MGRVKGLGRLGIALSGIAPVLAGCAGHNLSAPTAQTSSLTGRFSLGAVVSVRQVDRSDNDSAVAQIFTAFGRAPTDAPGGQSNS